MKMSLHPLAFVALLAAAGCGGTGAMSWTELAEERAEEFASGTAEASAADLLLVLFAASEQEAEQAMAGTRQATRRERDHDLASLTRPLAPAPSRGHVSTSPDPAPELGDGSASCPPGFMAERGDCRHTHGGEHYFKYRAVSPDPAPEGQR